MMMTVPVSVIIPCYCCSHTVERAVDSVAGQTVRPAEVILVDDASGDYTWKTLQSLRNQYGRDWINLVARSENGGPSVARNIGWDSAKEPYIAFLDADDAWHPRKLEIQYNWMMAHPDVALTGHPQVWLKNNEQLPELPEQEFAYQLTPLRLLLSNRFPTSSVMLRRELPFRFDPSKRRSEDYLLWLQIVISGVAVCRLDVPLSYFQKAPRGGQYLNGELWKREKAELATYSRLQKDRMISQAIYMLLRLFSLAKFLRRYFVSLQRS